jgi:hypothetical protein
MHIISHIDIVYKSLEANMAEPRGTPIEYCSSRHINDEYRTTHTLDLTAVVTIRHVLCVDYDGAETKIKLNSVALVLRRTIPTERPPHVGEVSANFCGFGVSSGQRNGSPRSLISIF